MARCAPWIAGHQAPTLLSSIFRSITVTVAGKRAVLKGCQTNHLVHDNPAYDDEDNCDQQHNDIGAPASFVVLVVRRGPGHGLFLCRIEARD